MKEPPGWATWFPLLVIIGLAVVLVAGVLVNNGDGRVMFFPLVTGVIAIGFLTWSMRHRIATSSSGAAVPTLLALTTIVPAAWLFGLPVGSGIFVAGWLLAATRSWPRALLLGLSTSLLLHGVFSVALGFRLGGGHWRELLARLTG